MKNAKQARRMLAVLLTAVLCLSAGVLSHAAEARYETDVPLIVEDAPDGAEYFVLVYPGFGRHYCSMEPEAGNTYNAAAGKNTGIIICYRPETIPVVRPAVASNGTIVDLEIAAIDPPTSEVVGVGMRPGVFDGMRALSFQLPSGTLRGAFWFDGRSAQPAPTASPAPSPSPVPTREPVPGMPFPGPDASFGIAEQGDGLALVGITAGTRSSAMSVRSVLADFDVPSGASAAILDSDGGARPGDEPVATGNVVLLTSPDGESEEISVIVRGDVVGTGLIGLTQLVRMAQAMREPGTLTGPYLAAGDFTGSGSITLADLIQESQLIRKAGR